MINNYAKTAFTLVATWSCLSFQTPAAQDLQNQYKIINRTLSAGSDPESIHLTEVPGVGIAWIKGREFSQGSIEFDVKGKDQLQHSFVGIAFHGLNDTTYEAVYFRPFNFRSTDPVRKGHAVQYIALPKYDWPRLRNDFPEKYEKPLPEAPDPNQWFHVRLVVESKKISVFVNNSRLAVLKVEPLAASNGKMIGLWAGNNSGGDWKNLRTQ
jgi:hypothetical protein